MNERRDGSGGRSMARWVNWRRGRDSNPRWVSPYSLSRGAPSATRPPLRTAQDTEIFGSPGARGRGWPDGKTTGFTGPWHRDGGEGGIRTLEGLAPLAVFKTAAFNRSATSPRRTPSAAKAISGRPDLPRHRTLSEPGERWTGPAPQASAGSRAIRRSAERCVFTKAPC